MKVITYCSEINESDGIQIKDITSESRTGTPLCIPASATEKRQHPQKKDG